MASAESTIMTAAVEVNAASPWLNLAYAIQIAIGLLFTIALLAKLREPSAFVATIRDFRVLPGAVTVPSAYLLLAAEAVVALSLVSGEGLSIGLPVALAASISFFTAVAINLRRGFALDCGCFGASSESISPKTLIRLALLIAATGLLLVLHVTGTALFSISAIWSIGTHAIGWAGALVALALSLLIAGLWTLNAKYVAFVWSASTSNLKVDQHQI